MQLHWRNYDNSSVQAIFYLDDMISRLMSEVICGMHDLLRRVPQQNVSRVLELLVSLPDIEPLDFGNKS